MFVGKKTYLAALGLVLTGIGGFLTGDLTVLAAVALVINGLGFAALRNGIATSK